MTLNDPRLNDSCGEEDERSLQQEGINEGGAAQGSQEAGQAREEEGTESEANDRGERLDPAVRFEGSLIVGAAESDKYSISWI